MADCFIIVTVNPYIELTLISLFYKFPECKYTGIVFFRKEHRKLIRQESAKYENDSLNLQSISQHMREPLN